MRSRLLLVAGLGILWAAAIAGRLYYLQVVEHDHFTARAKDQQKRVVELDAPRGTIYDARARELAVSIEVDSVYAIPSEIADPRAAARALAPLVGREQGKLARQLADRSRDFVWVGRKLDPPKSDAIRRLQLGGLRFVPESKRYYPMRELAAQVLGFVGTDNHGLEGIELRYDRTVAGKPGRRTVLRDARRGTAMDPEMSFYDPEPGGDLHLALDATIQHIVERELALAVDTRGARKGMAVFLDPRTGGVLALASYPSFDPNDYGAYGGAAGKALMRNRAIADAYEPGSTFKIVTAASALENGVVRSSDVIDCGLGGITLAGIRIRDHKRYGNLTFAETIAKSSNVGMIKTALLLGDERLYQSAVALGFGRKTGIDLPGEAPGILRPLSYWHRFPLIKAYVSFGQSVSVTPLQLAVAVSAIANGGTLVRPYVVESIGRAGKIETRRPAPEVVGRSISEATAAELGRLLEEVVLSGTGKSAEIRGYRVAGKTGTAQIPIAGGYDRSRYVPSFVGYAPAGRPVIAGVVAIDAPQGVEYYGAQVAAPVFGAITRQVLLYLGVRPERDAPQWPDAAPPAPPESGPEPLRTAALEAPPPLPQPASSPPVAIATPKTPAGGDAGFIRLKRRETEPVPAAAAPAVPTVPAATGPAIAAPGGGR
ncbi:MAG TPA: penicillin-binding transpeptidase domain-containing protein [Thermoanaerobaculia bacterium]|nr:penicillin-binding transpeptidase domain-containing protein [Thermoanaerobaculia bacterium]